MAEIIWKVKNMTTMGIATKLKKLYYISEFVIIKRGGVTNLPAPVHSHNSYLTK